VRFVRVVPMTSGIVTPRPRLHREAFPVESLNARERAPSEMPKSYFPRLCARSVRFRETRRRREASPAATAAFFRGRSAISADLASVLSRHVGF